MFKKIILSSFISLAAVSFSQAALRIVATTPDLADLVQLVGGEFVKVDTLAKGTEDIHAVPQRPSFVSLLNRANAVVHIGLGAEHAFLPALIEAAANADLQPGQRGDIDCSRYIKPMEVPTNLSRAEGELHPDGNPHYATDPRKAASMVKAIAEGLSKLDATHAKTFETNAASFVKELDGKIANWQRSTERLKGIKIISQHRDMVYLADFLGLQIIGEVEPKPGIAPSPKHLEQLVQRMKDEKVQLIINEVQYSDKTSRWLSEQTGAKIAIVATMGGAFPDSATYIGMVDHNINAILNALK